MRLAPGSSPSSRDRAGTSPGRVALSATLPQARETRDGQNWWRAIAASSVGQVVGSAPCLHFVFPSTTGCSLCVTFARSPQSGQVTTTSLIGASAVADLWVVLTRRRPPVQSAKRAAGRIIIIKILRRGVTKVTVHCRNHNE
jgi:hypothetical protein